MKEFLKENSASSSHKNKYVLQTTADEGVFIVSDKKPIIADKEELEKNPRAHSAKLRWAIRGTK